MNEANSDLSLSKSGIDNTDKSMITGDKYKEQTEHEIKNLMD